MNRGMVKEDGKNEKENGKERLEQGDSGGRKEDVHGRGFGLTVGVGDESEGL